MANYEKILLTGMWSHKQGETTFLSGSPGKEVRYEYVVLPNTKKERPNQPDYFLYLQKIDPKNKKQEKEREEENPDAIASLFTEKLTNS